VKRGIQFDVPFSGSEVLGFWGGYRYRAVARRGGGAFLLARERYPVHSPDDSFEVLAVCPSVEYARGLFRAVMRRDFTTSWRGRAWKRWYIYR
jgi:hypothetical protein